MPQNKEGPQMAFVLRFVQTYRPADREAFIALEAKFAQLEKKYPKQLPRGKRMQPYAGGLPTHTLIWECELPTIQAVNDALAALSGSGEHEELFRQQSPFMTSAITEIYEVLDM
jgi:hypothetical protein